MSEKDGDSVFLKPSIRKGYTMSVGDHLYNRIDRHLQTLKHIENTGQTRSNWLVECIKDKLERDKESLKSKEVPKDRHFHVKIDEKLEKKMLEYIEFHKRFRKSFSKKQWLLEAIHEKLSEEEAKLKELLKSKRQENPSIKF